jgi:glyoxylate reductase
MSARPVVLATLPLPDPAAEMIGELAQLRVLGRHPDATELAGELARDVVVLCPQLRDRITDDVLAGAGPQLVGVCNYAAGYDNIDVPAATRRGIWVTNTPDVVTQPTAELTITLMLGLARRVVEGDTELRAGRFTGWRPDYLLGMGLAGTRLGIIGLGRIGLEVARIAAALGMSVCHARTDGRAATGTPSWIETVDLAGLLATSDVVSLHAPLTDATRHLIGARELAAMKPNALLVNTSRGPLIDEAALAAALARREIAGAALDVYEQEPSVHPGLVGLSNTVLTPHIGTATVQARAAMARSCAQNVAALLRGQTPPSPVNRPESVARKDQREAGQD